MARAPWRVVFLVDCTLVLVQRRKVAHVHAEEVFLDVVRQRFKLICCVHVRRHREDLIELFER